MPLYLLVDPVSMGHRAKIYMPYHYPMEYNDGLKWMDFQMQNSCRRMDSALVS